MDNDTVCFKRIKRSYREDKTSPLFFRIRIVILGESIASSDHGQEVRIEFNLVRLNGDPEKVSAIYEGMQPLTAEGRS